jgi:hypothetical protein
MTPDEFNQFLNMVEKMRAAQNAYFRTRGGLDECRKIERAVDQRIKDLRERMAGQGKLFEE